MRSLFKLTVAALGMLCSVSAAHAVPANVVVFGDSLVHGFGLYQEDGLVSQLEGWLQAAGEEVALVNAGVSGDTTAGGAERVAWILTPDVDAAIVLFGGNDLLRGIFPEESRRNLDRILEALVSRNLPVLLIGHEAPANFGPEYKADFESMFPELARKHGVLLYPRFFAAIEAMGPREEVRPRYLQEDQLHPNREGVRLIVEDLGEPVRELLRAIE
ncbi:MAG: arylesterase [Rhodobacteraceae bacterium]|nr:arylesterase [Paracoccaceae bacterium]